MSNFNRGEGQIAWALGMAILLALAACVPVANGLLQQRHRTIRQNTLRRGILEASPVQIILSDSLVSECFSTEKNELLWGEIHYDVISSQHAGNCVIFKAVPDFKEMRFCTLISGDPATSKGQMARLMPFIYLFNVPILLLSPPVSSGIRAVFFLKKAAALAGFAWLYAPPPDLAVSSKHSIDQIFCDDPFQYKHSNQFLHEKYISAGLRSRPVQPCLLRKR